MGNSGKLRFELVLTRWEDGLFKSVDRILADSVESLEQQFETVMANIESGVEDLRTGYGVLDDDDIPF